MLYPEVTTEEEKKELESGLSGLDELSRHLTVYIERVRQNYPEKLGMHEKVNLYGRNLKYIINHPYVIEQGKDVAKYHDLVAEAETVLNKTFE